MILSRRDLLRGLLPAVTVSALAIEELIPSGRKIFLPPRPKKFTWDTYSDWTAGDGYQMINWPVQYRLDPSELIVNETMERIIREDLAAEARRGLDELFFRTMTGGRAFGRVEMVDDKVKFTPIVNWRAP